jgi:hypothetical protein
MGDERPNDVDRDAEERRVAAENVDPEPHHKLSNPADEPDETEYPDPYERREDPRDPASVDTPAEPADPEAVAGADEAPRDPSTSDPHPPRNYDAAREGGFDPEP